MSLVPMCGALTDVKHDFQIYFYIVDFTQAHRLSRSVVRACSKHGISFRAVGRHLVSAGARARFALRSHIDILSTTLNGVSRKRSGLVRQRRKWVSWRWRASSQEAKIDGGRRVKLWKPDTVAAQVLNPYGKSVALETMGTEALWTCSKKGNKHAAFHTEPASDDAGRIGIGISRTAETLLAVIAALREENMGKLLRPEPLAAALREADELEVHLRALNAGKGVGTGKGEMSFCRAPQASAPTQAKATGKDIAEACEVLQKWFSKPQRPLRAVLHLLSSGNPFHASDVS